MSIYIRCITLLLIYVLQNIMLVSNTTLPPVGIGPLFTFGHTIMSKKSFALSETINYAYFEDRSIFFAFTDAYYGITDKLTIIATLPILYQKQFLNNDTASGIGDIFFHTNYKFYSDLTEEYHYRIMNTIGIHLPTSTIPIKTLESLNAANFFIGITQDAITHNWFTYTDFGIILTTKHNHFKSGNVLLFNMGVGKIISLHKGFLTIFAELNDFYLRPDQIQGKLDLKTGQNIMLFGPTMRYIYENFLIQAEIQFVVANHTRFEQEDNLKHISGFLVAYTF